jgi:hypothetical protein
MLQLVPGRSLGLWKGLNKHMHGWANSIRLLLARLLIIACFGFTLSLMGTAELLGYLHTRISWIDWTQAAFGPLQEDWREEMQSIKVS